MSCSHLYICMVFVVSAGQLDGQFLNIKVGLHQPYLIGSIPWGHSGPLCHALSLSSSSSSWTSMRSRRATVAAVATPGE